MATFNDDVCPSQIDDLSREVGKLKEALNSLSQLSYSSGSPSKRQQQNQQVETMQQQIKQLQYQLAVRCPTVAVTVKKHEKVLLVCIQQMFFCAGVKEAAP